MNASGSRFRRDKTFRLLLDFRRSTVFFVVFCHFFSRTLSFYLFTSLCCTFFCLFWRLSLLKMFFSFCIFSSYFLFIPFNIHSFCTSLLYFPKICFFYFFFNLFFTFLSFFPSTVYFYFCSFHCFFLTFQTILLFSFLFLIFLQSSIHISYFTSLFRSAHHCLSQCPVAMTTNSLNLFLSFWASAETAVKMANFIALLSPVAL